MTKLIPQNYTMSFSDKLELLLVNHGIQSTAGSDVERGGRAVDGEGGSSDDGEGDSSDDGEGGSSDDGEGDSSDDGEGGSSDDGEGGSSDDGEGDSSDDGEGSLDQDGIDDGEDEQSGKLQPMNNDQRLLEYFRDNEVENEYEFSWADVERDLLIPRTEACKSIIFFQ